MPLSPLYRWAIGVADVARAYYDIHIAGCNAYLYVRPDGAICFALFYGREKGIWRELASRRSFALQDLPGDVQVLGIGAHNISKQLAGILFNPQEESENMKGGLKKALNASLEIAARGNSILDAGQEEKEPDKFVNTNEMISQMARAALNQDWFDFAQLGFEAVISLISNSPLSYADFVAAISQYIDAKIRKISEEEHLRFVGGECQLKVDEKMKKLETKAQLYFKNKKEAWIKKELSGQTDFEAFSAETLDNDIANILLEGGRKFPITPPEQ